MSFGPNKFLQGPCGNCGKLIRYPAHLVGTTGTCPICGQPTEFLLEEPESEPWLSRRALFWTIAAVLILIAGLIGSMVALKSARNLKNSRPTAVEPAVR